MWLFKTNIKQNFTRHIAQEKKNPYHYTATVTELFQKFLYKQIKLMKTISLVLLNNHSVF
jgi:hypothetical protein